MIWINKIYQWLYDTIFSTKINITTTIPWVENLWWRCWSIGPRRRGNTGATGTCKRTLPDKRICRIFWRTSRKQLSSILMYLQILQSIQFNLMWISPCRKNSNNDIKHLIKRVKQSYLHTSDEALTLQPMTNKIYNNHKVDQESMNHWWIDLLWTNQLFRMYW